MMSRISKESLPGGRNAAGGPQHLRRGRGLAAGGGSRDGDESLDLFARIRRNALINSTTESGGQNAAGQIKTLMEPAKLARSGAEDLLSADIGKSDYDWLLTPPGTPLFSSSDASEHQLTSAAPRSSSNVRSASATKASRLSVSQSENGQSTRPTTRSSSATRPSLSSTNSSSYFSNNNRTSHLNTSSASVTSRPTTPGKRSTTSSTTRANLAPASRPVTSRPSTPSKARTPSSSSGDKPRQLQSSRPSTPTGRANVPSANSSSSSSTSVPRSNSRPSTPTRRNPAPPPAPATSNSRPSTPNRRTPVLAPAPAMARSPSVSRIQTTNSRNPAPALRPSSPGPRTRAPPAQAPALPGFPHTVQASPRTKLPERPISASQQRPGVPLTVQAKPNSEAASMSLNRGRLSHNSMSKSQAKERSCSNGQDVRQPEIQTAVARPTKPASSTESTGFGRTISKKSIDMALRHMDIRQGMGIRGASLFPQSIRPTTSKGLPVRTFVDKAAPFDDERTSHLSSRENEKHYGMISSDSNLTFSEDGDGVVSSAEREPDVVRVTELDIYDSSRYDAILLKEDSKNLNWLHSIEDYSNQSPVFDHRFEPLPEPFNLT